MTYALNLNELDITAEGGQIGPRREVEIGSGTTDLSTSQHGTQSRLVYDGDPYHRIEDRPYMQFRLTYSGELLSTGNDSYHKSGKRADHKHELRKRLHPQLKRLWETTPFLKTGERSGPSARRLAGDAATDYTYHVDHLASKYAYFGWNFVPLVTSDLDLMCGVEVLFLRPHKPGGIVNQGDVDGRLKTLLDALSVPDANQGYTNRIPEPGETPMFVLLADDRLITKVSVETDQLLETVSPDDPVNDVRLVITVNIRPYEVHLGNLQFG